ncbi:Protein translocase subunit SecA [Dissostichus eleginoides]|uniref:Protein translocase subunit SecA n=1 Tax=Dissostichus eleginoides TaxID=100907 RepID=A0AAD9B4Z5_DISEL|nr:Protein translocase subunit SecA [Dissostichus eleginoides]
MYGRDILSHMHKASITSTFGSILKMDSTKKTTEPTDIRRLCVRGLPIILGDEPSAFFQTCTDAADKEEGNVVMDGPATLPQALCVLFGPATLPQACCVLFGPATLPQALCVLFGPATLPQALCVLFGPANLPQACCVLFGPATLPQASVSCSDRLPCLRPSVSCSDRLPCLRPSVSCSDRLPCLRPAPCFTSSSSTSDSITAGTWSTGRDCEQVNPWGESSPDDHRSEGQGRPGTETNTPPAAERNLLTAGTPRDRNKHTSSCREEPSDSRDAPGQKQTHLQLQRGTF